MVSTYLASSLLMGVLLLAVVVLIVGARDWYEYTPTVVGTPGGGDVFASTARAVRSPVTWTVSFLVFVFALLAAGLAFVGSPLFGFADPAVMGTVMGALAGLLFVIYVFAGTYFLAKSRGLGDAAATLLGAGIIALLFIAAVFVNLLTGG